MILTTADVAEAAMQNAIQAVTASGEGAKKQSKVDAINDRPGLDIIGPKGAQAYVHSLRHFYET